MAFNLEFLIQILEHILRPQDHGIPNWILDPSTRSLFESVLVKANLLKEFCENSSSVTSHGMRSLESRIRDAAYHAEDIILSHMEGQLHSRKKGESIVIPPPDFLRVMNDYEFERIVEEMLNVLDGGSCRGRGASSSNLVSSGKDLNAKNIVVGISEDLAKLMDRLTSDQLKLEIIPIVGMGGIGKTTLARNLYDDPVVVSHFDCRAWVAISQHYSIRDILLHLLQCTNKSPSDENESKEEEIAKLALRLHQTLYGRRYLIVVDDIWSCDAWDDIQRFFPNEGNRSRVLVTTREQSVADYVASQNQHHHMTFLNEDESWNLLQRKILAEEPCSKELEQVGKNIANRCKGLPLAIHVVGGVLSQLEKTVECWRQVSGDIHSTMSNNDEQFLNILSLSYNHLPNHLKSCFLYMSTFRGVREIRASKLIMLWAAEGFLKPISGESLEEAGEACLRELIDRNLVLVHKLEITGKVKSCMMHDLLKDLCIRKRQEERFPWPISDKKCGMFGKKLQRVLTTYYNLERMEGCELVDVRYLDTQISSYSQCWSWISSMRYLQTLILRVQLPKEENFCVFEPHEFFLRSRLRHIQFKRHYPLFCLPNGESITLQENLQTLSTVALNDSLPKILEATPNLKKLGIFRHGSVKISSSLNLMCLSKLESLKFSSKPFCSFSFSCLTFPPSLKKVTIELCLCSDMPDGVMSKIGALPNLEVLKLKSSEIVSSIFGNETWEPKEGEFRQLRFLLLDGVFLKKWIADEMHYPRLKRLVIRDCYSLEEIPIGIGDIPTLERIELDGINTATLLESAKKIQERQMEIGNDDLQVLINAYVGR